MNQKKTELVFIIDRSGSMSGLENDTIGGFNSMISKQKEQEGEAIVSTVLFSNTTQILHDRVRIADVGKLTEKDYFVSGSTALLDAVGETVGRIGRKQQLDPEGDRPGQTLVVITTDGYENSSSEYTYGKISELIEKKKSCGWDFLFLGANIDVAKEAERMNIANYAEYDCSEDGLRNCYDELSVKVCCARRCGSFDKK